MYNIDDIGSTYVSLPPSLQTGENECFAYALDRQAEKLNKLMQKLNVWGNLDQVDPKYYDALAVCVQVPYYRSDYSNEMKLQLIKSAPMFYRYAGTQKAVEKMLEIVFEQAKFIPWHEYGGKPYHFKVIVYDLLTEDAVTIFKKVLRKVKALRSVIDEIEVAREVDLSIFAGCSINIVYRPDAVREALKDSNSAGQTIYASSAATSVEEQAKAREALNAKGDDVTQTVCAASNAHGMFCRPDAAREALKDSNSAGQTIYISSSTAGTGKHEQIRETLNTKGDDAAQVVYAAVQVNHINQS